MNSDDAFECIIATWLTLASVSREIATPKTDEEGHTRFDWLEPRLRAFFETLDDAAPPRNTATRAVARRDEPGRRLA